MNIGKPKEIVEVREVREVREVPPKSPPRPLRNPTPAQPEKVPA